MPDNRPHIEIYTDGGCSPNPGPGGWAAILIHPTHTRELTGSAAQTTNNRMELTAAVEALRALDQPHVIDFHTDSEYLRKGITQWLPGWIANGWKRGSGADAAPVANVDLWQDLAQATRLHTIHWHWVKGHAGDALNERADELASAAIPKPAAAPDDASIQVYLRIAGTAPRGPHGWAAAVIRGEDTTILQGGSPDATPNHFALQAALSVLRRLPPEESIHFHTNNSYLHDGITTWVEGWRRKGWTKPDLFRAEWQALDQINRSRQIRWSRFSNDGAPEPFQALRPVVEAARDAASRAR